ncbi:MAG: protease modulator HflC [Alphaproteobacteria bacterium]|nr:protease modulator HflC [Alphaproteobacteria bacterium]
MNIRLLAWLGAGFLALVIISSSFFTVAQRQQAIVFQFREVVRVVERPGLHAKWPFIQDVDFFDKRVLAVDAPTQEIMLAEQKPLEVDAFARYRIVDPVLFFQRLRDERIANDRLGSLLNATMRSILGTVKTSTLLSPERVKVMGKIRGLLNAETKDFGIEIVDVRIRRTDLPQKTSDAVFSRMRSQREQEAAQLRAAGQQEALQTTSEADREATVILAEAQGKAEKLKGEGDRKALEIMADATSRDPQFFAFWRSLTAYKESLKPENTTFILSPESEFFRYFNAPSGK